MSVGPGSAVPAFYRRRKKRGNEIGQVLLRDGLIRPEDLRVGLRMQEEKGGQIGRILVEMGACDERAIARALIRQLQLAREAGKGASVSMAAREQPEIAGLQVVCRPRLTGIVLLLGDLLALALAVVFSNLPAYLSSGVTFAVALQRGLPVLLLAVAFAMLHLYAPASFSPPEELRRMTQVTTLVFVGLALVGLRPEGGVVRAGYGSLFAQWLLSLYLVPIVRALIRDALARKAWWGHAVVVLGAGKTGRMIVRTLKKRPSLGLKPVALLDDDPVKHGTLRAEVDEG
ncbi:MAG TPA: hypothetical protein VJT73_09800, partial [Polyangiaceae bacterium]|nr:hypothetical protein [Polyangiaceae bacterium]